MTLTIDDVARLAGVSKTTVSLIINGKSAASRISAATERRVRSIVRAKGFAPSHYARGLRARRTETVGFVAPDFVNPFFARLNQALERVARRQGYQVLVACSEDDPALEKAVVESLVSRRVDGLIVASVLDERRLRARGDRQPAPTVFIDREIAQGNASSVASENRAGARAAVDELIRRGARRIAFLGGTRTLSTSRHRFAGYLSALADRGLSPDRRLIFHGDYRAESGQRMMERLRTSRVAADAVFTSAYTLLEGVLAHLRERSGSLPATPALGTFDDHPLLDYLPVPVVSVRQDTEGLARAAFSLLRRALAGEPAVQHRRVPTRLIAR